MSYSMASSILRFSSKYMAHSIRKQVIEQFKHVIPQSFGEVGHTKSYTQVFGSDEPQPHPFQLLSLFRECKLMSFLPWTYYTVCSLGFEKICQGDTTHDGKEIRLDADDTRIALLGWKTLCQMTHDIRRLAINSNFCKTGSCSNDTMRLVWTQRATSTFQSEAMEEWEMFKVLAYPGKPVEKSLYDGYQFTLSHGRPCGCCTMAWLKEEKKGRAKVWLQLPGIFGLPDWDIETRGKVVTGIRFLNSALEADLVPMYAIFQMD
ncbi:hypothetical protein Clacol_004203 [Clathrus columnatus]|uniref:Uncharacterized protein n=1 Tax=Clathrus columnatus TaxID=1419009 RepID=A0AAV5A945_9AGAM|nr:hypothetical protein Clacol_004203 [Clathrus columnatus]